MPPARRTFLPPLILLTSVCFIEPKLVAQTDEPRPLFVEGYTRQVSYAPGEEITFHVSTSAPDFAVEIARLGACLLYTSPSPRDH
jgi:hypothetical protein